MENIFIYDLETYTKEDGSLQVYAMGILSLESVMKNPEMKAILRKIKYKKILEQKGDKTPYE